MTQVPDRPTPPAPPGSDAPGELAPAADARIVLCTAPPDGADRLARALVEERLAACVSRVPGLRSTYRWKGSVHEDPETLLVIKTTADRLPVLTTRIHELHTYELPEVLVLEPTLGGAQYLAWLAASTAPDAGP